LCNYVDILKELIEDRHIESMVDLNEIGENARDYITNLPARLVRVAERMKNPMLEYKFSWINW
jgi:acyl-[acyl-carrier-protein] desaturase